VPLAGLDVIGERIHTLVGASPVTLDEEHLFALLAEFVATFEQGVAFSGGLW
jgi:hypothetical protein